jgi:hypothetical protein
MDMTSITIKKFLFLFCASVPLDTSPMAWIPIAQDAIESTETAIIKIFVSNGNGITIT